MDLLQEMFLLPVFGFISHWRRQQGRSSELQCSANRCMHRDVCVQHSHASLIKMSSPCRISFSNKCAYDFPLIAFQSQNTLYLILSLVLVLLLGFYEAWYKTVNGSSSTDLYVSPTLPVGFLLKNLRRARQTAPADGTPSTARRDTKQTKTTVVCPAQPS